jgi:hypothetical protein
MSSTSDAEPIGFFSLALELRDQIVSTKLRIHGGDQDVLLTDTLRLDQYDMLHQDQEVVDFGGKEKLEIRYPLPRLHQISRRFTAECDLRAPAQPLVVISQKHALFNARGWIRFPKILRLRDKPHFLVQQLQINMRVDLSEDGLRQGIMSCLLDCHLEVRLEWVKGVIRVNCSGANAGNVLLRLMFDSTAGATRDIADTLREIWSLRSHRFPTVGLCRVEALMNIPNEQGEYENNYEGATPLSVKAAGQENWEFNHQAIEQ